MLICYQIMTEDKNRGAVLNILDAHFDGYTVVYGEGRWKGKSEQSMVIIVLTDRPVSVQMAAEEIKLVNQQESVLVIEVSPSSVNFI